MWKNRKVSPALFAFALVCFFMPFVSVSCDGSRLKSLTGIQLVTGTTVEQPALFGPRQTKRVDGDPVAMLAFLCGLVGLGVGFLKSKTSHVAGVAAGVGGVLLLLLLKNRGDNEIMQEGKGLLEIDWELGFWLVLLLYLGGAILSAYAVAQSKKTEGATLPSPVPPG